MYIRKCKIRKFISLQNVLLAFVTIWNLYPSPVNKTVQRNLKRSTKLHNEVYNLLYNKIYWKLEFSVCSDFVKQTKNKDPQLHPQLSIQAISRDIPLTW